MWVRGWKISKLLFFQQMKDIKAVPCLEQSHLYKLVSRDTACPTETKLTVMSPAAYPGEVLLGWCDKDNIHVGYHRRSHMKITLNSCLQKTGRGQLLDSGQENYLGPIGRVCAWNNHFIKAQDPFYEPQLPALITKALKFHLRAMCSFISFSYHNKIKVLDYYPELCNSG